MASRCCRVSCSAWNARAAASSPSKGWRRTAAWTRCRRRLPTWAPRSAATARRDSWLLRKRCSTSIRIRRANRSRTPSPAIYAAARGISRSLKPWRPRLEGTANPGEVTLNIIGKPRRRVDGRAKVTGQTKFADDIMLPRMVHCKLLRSTLPHARIVRVDAARARAHPGVLLVLDGRDFPIAYGILPVSQDEHALALERVRFVGDPVAAVVARDELAAFEALDLIDVDYEPLRTLSGPDDSLAHPEARLHDYG